jgi:tRNA-splicing ligase RtcB (3'-phosphate/5'-hydroxy nucleic acid ligase)
LLAVDLAQLERKAEWVWEVPRAGRMLVPGILYASEDLVREMDDKVREQIANVATLPGIVQAAYAMPDAHWGYGFPIGGVAAFDPENGGVISAGGVGFDISCGVRTVLTGVGRDDIEKVRVKLADALFHGVPAGVGSTSSLRLNPKEMNAMLAGGALWAVQRGYGEAADLERIESGGRWEGAEPDRVSEQARRRQTDEMGTLGSGNHYLEVQVVTEIHDPNLATAFGLRVNAAVVSIHCGSRGLGHQVATEFARTMVTCAAHYGVPLYDRELAAVPVRSPPGEAYFGAMRAAANCALANREILTHFVRAIFGRVLGGTTMPLLYDVSHNVCSLEEHVVDGRHLGLYVHRKGATRAFGPGHPELPDNLRTTGQPVLVGGTMGTASYILAGTKESEGLAYSSACHGAGRNISRTQALKQFRGQDVIEKLTRRNITVRSNSYRGIAEEAPGAYKDVSAVVDVTDRAGLARRVARLEPMICVKG